ncbi:unnamed protein product [Ceutorhynchus assimilis]|uniref:Sulfatase N-terminal domain-containing protein n=1 Tax=Ceutorhynchus assimilis TaxID=467358 RepID=A0A9N9QKV5_9CUCU|nr:unnamed protein product [Ceutorhynchus assimilis]
MANNNMFKILIGTILFISSASSTSTRPHIVFIIADDLGFNDVSFHGSGQIPTPNIDALAYSGLILNNYYVNPICTPSRSALMTGKYPIHTGMQHTVLYGAEPRGLPLTEKLLPQYLQELGYVNRIVGKWHLGSWKKEYTPLYRGFVSHLGYWTGHQDYYDHSAVEKPGWGLDMRVNMSIGYQLHGQYSTDLFTEESVNIINQHDKNRPLFLYLAHAAVHSANPYNPLPAPDEEVAKFPIDDYKRQRFAGVLSKLDESVGRVVAALKHNDMLENSIIVFTTDNGGPAAGFNLNAASNYPLKGVKNTLWEGGIRGAALLWSPLIKTPSRVSTQLMQIVDWLPTLLTAAGGTNNHDLKDLDGQSIWNALSHNIESPRHEILHNIDDIYGNAALMLDNWKLIQGTTYEGAWDNWYGPSGRNQPYNTSLIHQSLVGKALRSISDSTINRLRSEATVQCGNATVVPCDPIKAACLFDIAKDPCEYINLADKYPNVVETLKLKLQQYNASAVPPGNLPLDPRGDPKHWNYVFTNFGDYEEMVTVT